MTCSEHSLEHYCCNIIDHCLEFSQPWQWDDWFGAAMLVVEGGERARLMEHLTPVLPYRWSHAQTHHNVDNIGRLSRVIGGLEQHQLLLSSRLDRQPVILAAWWPWGEGERVSVRVVIATEQLTHSEQRFIQAHFRQWFRI